MAKTSYGVNAPEAVKLWSEKLFREALAATWASKFMGTDSNSLIQILEDTQKGPGDRIRTILRMQLSGDGIQGDGTLEGNEEALVTHTDNLLIDQLRHAVRSAGRMTEQRIPFSIREEARMGLQDWWADKFDTWFMNQISSNTAVTDQRNTGLNAVTTADANHAIYAGVATAESNLSANSSQTFSLEIIDRAVVRAKTVTPLMRQIALDGGERRLVMFLTPEQVYDLRINTNTGQWLDIQKAAMQGGRIGENPIFNGALGVYNDVILHESTRLPLITTANGANQGGRAVLAGPQACMMAFGRANSPMRATWVEELFDFGNSLGVAAGFISGLKKTVYNSEDFSTIRVSTAHSTAAVAASARD